MPRRAAQLFVRSLDLVELPMPVDLGQFGYWLAWHERARRDRSLLALVDLLAAACAGDS